MEAQQADLDITELEELEKKLTSAFENMYAQLEEKKQEAIQEEMDNK